MQKSSVYHISCGRIIYIRYKQGTNRPYYVCSECKCNGDKSYFAWADEDYSKRFSDEEIKPMNTKKRKLEYNNQPTGYDNPKHIDVKLVEEAVDRRIRVIEQKIDQILANLRHHEVGEEDEETQSKEN